MNSLIKSSSNSLKSPRVKGKKPEEEADHRIFNYSKEDLARFGPTLEELASHHGPYIKLMHEIFCLLPGKEIGMKLPKFST